MKNTKTQRDFYKEIAELAENAGKADIVEFANSRIALLDKKALNKGETAKQKENEVIKAMVLETLVALEDKMVTVTELLQDKDINEKVQGSNQKLTALLTQLKKENKIANVKDGKKSYYKAI
jgi:chromosome condensin MukBEF ATPase and DNA-binding subunit MukB